MSLKQPVGQKRLTNVAIVRLKTHGKRFEIACYKNKVLDWREGIEKDLSEVIQVDTIFSNVSRGVAAKEQELKQVFGSARNEEICRKILKSGDLQVSDKERELHLEGLFRDIVQNVVERCVHPQTGRQLTPATVESALKRIGFSVHPDHAPKKQALKAIESLCAEIPESFSRAKMNLRISCPDKLSDEFRRHLVEEAQATILEESCSSTPATEGSSAAFRTFSFVCEPSHYRELDRLVTITHAGENASIQIISSAVLGNVGAGAMKAASGEAHSGSANDEIVQAKQLPQATPPAKKGIRCSACGVEFEDAAAYRAHCRSDWHNFNLKRKVKGLPPVSEEEFAEIALDVREGFLGGE